MTGGNLLELELKAGGHKAMSSILADHVTNSSFIYEPKCAAWGGGGGGSRVSANEYNFARRAQVNFGDLTPYLIYG